jgi:hypothetical protein
VLKTQGSGSRLLTQLISLCRCYPVSRSRHLAATNGGAACLSTFKQMSATGLSAIQHPPLQCVLMVCMGVQQAHLKVCGGPRSRNGFATDPIPLSRANALRERVCREGLPSLALVTLRPLRQVQPPREPPRAHSGKPAFGHCAPADAPAARSARPRPWRAVAAG